MMGASGVDHRTAGEYKKIIMLLSVLGCETQHWPLPKAQAKDCREEKIGSKWESPC